jgi:hypothetical protein
VRAAGTQPGLKVLWRITMTASGQWLSKHVSAATNTHSTIELLLQTPCFYVIHAEVLYASSNTYTVTLRVVGGDEKGSLKSETVKYGRESQGTQTRERLRWQGAAAYTKDGLVLSSERAPHKNKAVTVKQ